VTLTLEHHATVTDLSRMPYRYAVCFRPARDWPPFCLPVRTAATLLVSRSQSRPWSVSVARVSKLPSATAVSMPPSSGVGRDADSPNHRIAAIRSNGKQITTRYKIHNKMLIVDHAGMPRTDGFAAGRLSSDIGELPPFLTGALQPEGLNVSTWSTSILLRPYDYSDRHAVFGLLVDLPRNYPRGHEWLDGRLNDVTRGKAQCTVATVRPGHIVGLAIRTPKGPHRLKLSNLFVDPRHRNFGIGSKLLAEARHRWTEEGVNEVYLTAPAHQLHSLLPIFHHFDFAFETVEFDRYGCGRDEVVYFWKPRSSGRQGPHL
jgi:GNAT superfamily N-acetyltransferase